MKKNSDFIVLGGGIIGMMTAYELAASGATVTLFDKSELGMESSWAAGGILSSMRPWTEHPDSAELSEHGKILYPDLAERLQRETGIDPEYVRSGLMIIEEAHIGETKTWANSVRVNIEHSNINTLSAINLPNQSVLLPDIAQIRPPMLIAALRKSLKQMSVTIHENTRIERLHIKNEQFSHVEFENKKTYANAVIITAGAWSSLLLEEINFQIDINPIHGQMLCVKPKEQLLSQIILDGGHYFIPRLDGHLLIGSTMEDVGYNKMTTSSARDELLDWAYSIWPDLKSAQIVKHWSGLRPSTNTQKPFIGLLSGFENIYLNTGHFRKGILQAPSSAKLLVDTISGRSTFMDIDKLSNSKRVNLAESV